MEVKGPTRPMQYDYYKDRHDNWYTKHTKAELRDMINPLEPATFIPILKEMDYPYIEGIWRSCLANSANNAYENLGYKPKSRIFAHYIARMRTIALQDKTFKDSLYNQDVVKFHLCAFSIEKTKGD